MRHSLYAALLIGAFALAGCGGGGSHGVVTPPSSNGNSSGSAGSSGASIANAPHNTAAAPGAVSANVTVRIPLTNQANAKARTPSFMHTVRGIKRLAQSQSRKPSYLTSYTYGIDLEAYQNGNYSGYVFYPLSPQQSYCTVVNTNVLSCNLSLQAPPGSTTLIVHTYDSTTNPNDGPTNMLSAGSQTFTIAGGTTNNLTITTNPVASTFATVTPPGCETIGTPVSTSSAYTAYDADGGDLTGYTLANSFSFANLNTDDPSPSTGWSISPSTITSGSGTLSFSYNGSDPYLAAYVLTQSFAPDGETNLSYGTAFVPVTTAGPHWIYFLDSANSTLHQTDLCSMNANNITDNAYSLGFVPTHIKVDRLSSTADPHLFVSSNNNLYVVDAGTSPGTILAGPVSPGGAIHQFNDSSVNAVLYGTTSTPKVYKYVTSESSPYLSGLVTNATTNASLSNPTHIALNGNGNDLLVSDPGAGRVFEINPSSSPSPMAIDNTIDLTSNGLSAPNSLSPPMQNGTCVIVSDNTNKSFMGLSIGADGSGASGPIGGSYGALSLDFVVSFPPETSAGMYTALGNGFGGYAAMAVGNGIVYLVYCDGSGVALGQFPFPSAAGNGSSSFMSNPASYAPSNYASTAVPALTYIVGNDNGSPVLYAYSKYASIPMLSYFVSGSATPNLTDVTAGP